MDQHILLRQESQNSGEYRASERAADVQHKRSNTTRHFSQWSASSVPRTDVGRDGELVVMEQTTKCVL